MSEAYECDRCGGLREGTPDTDVQVMEGKQRVGRQDDHLTEHREGMPITQDIYDLCPACRNDLRRWFREGGASVLFGHTEDADE